MTISLPAPLLDISKWPKVPIQVVLAIVLVQYGINAVNSDSNSKPICSMNIEQPHKSTWIKENNHVGALKMNITTACNQPQEFTTLSASIFTLSPNGPIIVHKFATKVQEPLSTNSRIVKIRDLFTPCNELGSAYYLGVASGVVQLKSGKQFKLSGSSNKFLRVNCQIDAK